MDKFTLETLRNDAWRYILMNNIPQSRLAEDIDCYKSNFNKFMNGKASLAKVSIFKLINLLYKLERRCNYESVENLR